MAAEPFTMVLNSVLFDPQLSAKAVRLVAALEDFSGEHRTCWPGYVALAEKVCCSARWVPELLKKLVEAGLLTIQYRHGKTNIYTLLARVARRKATQEVYSRPPKKRSSHEPKQPTKTNKEGGSTPLKGNIDFSKYLPGGKHERLGVITG